MLINTLFFDLDGTLYPNENGMWEAIADRMESYMSEYLDLPKEKIPALRQGYFQKYGTTLKGLQENYSIDNEEYLSYVHDIPLEHYLKPDERLKKILEGLPIKKWIFTNSDRAHAQRVLNALDIQNLFEDIFDITMMDYLNKPNPVVYHKALKFVGSPEPDECVFIEDSPRNLAPAKKIGMWTVLVGNKTSGLETDYSIPNIYSIKDLIVNLNGTNKKCLTP